MGGAVMCAVGALLVFIGMPKRGVTPRFLRFDAATVVYPPVPLTLMAFGVTLIFRSL